MELICKASPYGLTHHCVPSPGADFFANQVANEKMSAWTFGSEKTGIRAGKEMLKNKTLFLVAMLLSGDGGFLLPCCNPQRVLVKLVVQEDPDPHAAVAGALLGNPHGHPKGLRGLMVPTSTAGITILVAAAASSWLRPELISFRGPTVKLNL